MIITFTINSNSANLIITNEWRHTTGQRVANGRKAEHSWESEGSAELSGLILIKLDFLYIAFRIF